MKLYGGIDLHSNNSVITLLDEQDQACRYLVIDFGGSLVIHVLMNIMNNNKLFDIFQL